MKILKKGVKPPPPVYRGTCSTCGCKVEFDEREKCSFIVEVAILCPTCHTVITGRVCRP